MASETKRRAHHHHPHASDGHGHPPRHAQSADAANAQTAPQPQSTATVWTCPMHPEIRRNAPGTCPICGMALEPLAPTREEGENAELADMTRRFWVCAALTVPLLWPMLGRALPAIDPMRVLPHSAVAWVAARCSRLPSCSGAAGRSSSAAGSRVVNSQPQHVHADRARHRRGVDRSPSPRRSCPTSLPAVVSRRSRVRRRCTSRRPP